MNDESRSRRDRYDVTGNVEAEYVDADGLVDADLQLTIRDPKGLSVVLADAIPEERNTIEAGFSGLVLLGAQPSLPVFIRKGAARLGFIQLGQIPPLK